MTISIYAPLDNFVDIFSWVHSFYMGFKVVASRPRLVRFFASCHGAHITFLTSLTMHSSLMSFEVMGALEARKVLWQLTAPIVTLVLPTLFSKLCQHLKSDRNVV